MKSHTLIRGAALAGALTLAHASAALAAAGESTPLHLGTPSAVHAAAGSSSSGIVRTIIGLFIVIAVIYGVAWVLRQAKGAKHRPSGHGLSQVASLPLGGGRSVALVRAGQEIVLLGIADHSVTPIRTYTEAEALSLGLELPDDDMASAATSAKPVGRVVETLRRATVRS
jgi:flagellar protein FliO/FliZ